MPTATFTHQAMAAASALMVFESLQHAATWMRLGVMDEVSDEVRRDERLVSFGWTASVGGTKHKGTARVTTAEPGNRMVLSLNSAEVEGELEVLIGESGASLPPKGGVARRAEGGVGGSSKAIGPTSVLLVTLTARPRGFVASMFWGKISDALGRGLPARVEEFADGF